MSPDEGAVSTKSEQMENRCDDKPDSGSNEDHEAIGQRPMATSPDAQMNNASFEDAGSRVDDWGDSDDWDDDMGVTSLRRDTLIATPSTGAKEVPVQDKLEKHSASLQIKTYLFDRDEDLALDDPYTKKGCERRMVFTSDDVPMEARYAHYNGPEEDRPQWRNAVDKFLQWCVSRPSSARRGTPDWEEAGYNDGRTARHFVLKMGPPHGLFGEPDRLAARLKSVWLQFLNNRLRSSHVTIETEIPFGRAAGTDYFKAYMSQLLDLTTPKKMGDRLTIRLAAEPTKRLYNMSPKVFYPKQIDVDKEWDKIRNDSKNGHESIMSLVYPSFRHASIGGSNKAVARPDEKDIQQAGDIYRKQKAAEFQAKRWAVDTAIAETKWFIELVRKFEQSKSSPSEQLLAAPSMDLPGDSKQEGQTLQARYMERRGRYRKLQFGPPPITAAIDLEQVHDGPQSSP
jgi:hypothetical protein